MSGHFICDRCGYEGHADWCVYLRPVEDRWRGHRTADEMKALKNEKEAALSISTPVREGE